MSAAMVTDTWLDHSTTVMCQKLWPGGWEISVQLPHIFNSSLSKAQARRWLISRAVVDDFGNLIAVEPLQ